MKTRPEENGERPERRGRPQRRPAASVPSITGIRLSPFGIDATLINISETGLLAECAERLKPGAVLTIVFDGPIGVRSVKGRVARSTVSMAGGHHLRYHVGILFDKPIVLPEAAPPAQPKNRTRDPAPPATRNRW